MASCNENKNMSINCKHVKTLDTWITAVIILKFNNVVYNTVMYPKDADGMTNTVDPDQAALKGAVQ